MDSVALLNTSPVFCATAFADEARSSVNVFGLGSSFAIRVTMISSGLSVFSSMITSPDDSLSFHMIEYLLADFSVMRLRGCAKESSNQQFLRADSIGCSRGKAIALEPAL